MALVASDERIEEIDEYAKASSIDDIVKENFGYVKDVIYKILQLVRHWRL